MVGNFAAKVCKFDVEVGNFIASIGNFAIEV
jgi:hypothetical protein